MRNCDVCGKNIDKLHRLAKRCSYECVLEHKRQMTLEKNGGLSCCVICGTRYERRSSGQKTCCKACGKKLKNRQGKKKTVEIDTATAMVRMRNMFLLAG